MAEMIAWQSSTPVPETHSIHCADFNEITNHVHRIHPTTNPGEWIQYTPQTSGTTCGKVRNMINESHRSAQFLKSPAPTTPPAPFDPVFTYHSPIACSIIDSIEIAKIDGHEILMDANFVYVI